MKMIIMVMIPIPNYSLFRRDIDGMSGRKLCTSSVSLLYTLLLFPQTPDDHFTDADDPPFLTKMTDFVDLMAVSFLDIGASGFPQTCTSSKLSSIVRDSPSLRIEIYDYHNGYIF